jgi:hypothetical protein
MHNAMPWMVAGALLLAGVGAEAGQAGGPPRSVKGEVATVDEARGTLTLRLTPAAMKGLRKGDHVVIRVPAPEKAEKPAAEVRPAATPKTP